jgi:putative hydrolase of the HAD superfamily
MQYTTLLIDLDETVYPSSCGVWDAISERMEQWMHERLNLPWEEIPALRKQLYHEYGTTLRGLQVTCHIDERDFLDFVHNVAVDQMIQPDPALRKVLLRYPQRRIIFTNADHKHAGRVLRQLQLEDCFEGIIDIYDIAPYCKPMPEAYQTALRLSGETSPERCIFIDDSPRNLEGARQAGLYTIQVGMPKPDFKHSSVAGHLHIPRLIDLPTVLPPEEEYQDADHTD